MADPLIEFDFAPFRLSGVVYGVLMNAPEALAGLGEAVSQPPYKAPPDAPVLYMKPRTSLVADGGAIPLPPGYDEVEIGATLGMVIGRAACRVTEAEALSYVAGYVAVQDVCLPHEAFYRPSLRLRARDGFCPLGPKVVAAGQVADPDALAIRVTIDGVQVESSSTSGRIRKATRLISDVTEFMTLQPGDVLLLGPSAVSPRARAGQRVEVEIDGLGTLQSTVRSEEVAP